MAKSSAKSSPQTDMEHISEMQASGPRTFVATDFGEMSINTKVPSPTPATTEVPTISELVRSSEPQEDTTHSEVAKDEQVVIATLSEDSAVQEESSSNRLNHLDESSTSSDLVRIF